MNNSFRFLSRKLNNSTLRLQLARIRQVFTILVFLASLIGGPATSARAITITFTAEELLGKPTDTSVTVNIVPASAIEYKYEYGTTQGGPYTGSTPPVTATGGQPHEVVIGGLQPDTRYYYRMVYDGDGDIEDGDFETRAEHTFQTQRAAGEEFVFTVTSDSHATFNTAHQNAMTNVLNELPDFHIDIGDTFYPASGTTTQTAVNNAYLAFRDPLYMDRIGHSVPIFLAAGNHEEEEGWNLDDTPFSIGVGSIQARKAYFPTPIDDGFYSGNTDPLPAIDEATYGDEYREDYYAWEWGDALFVVIDEFQYTMDLPYSPAAGEGSDDSVTGDQWSWTLGEQQYNWLKQTLENSPAKYKFVFSHNMLGGVPRSIVGVGAGYVRGGAEAAEYFEWGGNNADGTWGFDTQRPGWDAPIHQLFVENGVSAYFHGHDHQYVYETRDGIVYQEVPSPSMSGSGFTGIYTEGVYTDYSTIEMLPNSGHLRITVDPTEATVDYISSSSTAGTVNYSYTIEPSEVTEPDFTITATAGANGSISPSGEVGVVAGADQGFTITPAGGYQVADVLVDGASVGAVTSYTFTNVQADHTITASFEAASLTGIVTLDGAVSSGTADDVSTISITHTTGTGTDRLMLVGVSWNAGSTDRTISSVTYTPSGGSATALNLVKTQQAGTQLRYSAIYSLPDPPSGQAGTVAVTFSGSVSNGIMAGAANFAGVDQTTPLGTPDGAGSTSQTSTPSVTLTGLNGNELVFDNLFMGASSSSQTLTVGSDQTPLWNPAYVANIRAAASTEQATTSSVTMSWTAASSAYWAIAAVPINPAPGSGTTYELTMANDGNGTTEPEAGTHTYAEGTVVNLTAAPNQGFVFDTWTGDADCADGSVTMNADKTCTANFVEAPPTAEVTLDGVFSSGTGAANATSATFSHTIGTGTNRLMLVGVSWNCGTTNRTISSATFTPEGGSALDLTEVKTQQYSWTTSGSTNYRYAAIYSLVNPSSGVTGAVTVNFSGAVSNGIVVGAANFAGVEQTTPLGTPNGAGGTSTETPATPTVNLTGLNGNELVFDTVFIGVSNTAHTLTADSGQSALWNVTNYSSSNSFNTRGAASTEQAAGPSVTMSWTPGGYGSTATRWTIAAVPINPAPVSGTAYDLTVAADPVAGGTTAPAVGVHSYPEDQVVNITATPAEDYAFDHWSGDCSGTGACQVTMDSDKSVTANFTVEAIPVTFTGSELLGRPEANSISINVVPDANISLYYEYGTTSGVYTNTTSTVTATGGQPQVVTIGGLTANTKYYYRMQYSPNGGSSWIARSENSFQTQRAEGSTFTFDVTTDSHVDIQLGNESNWISTLNGIAADQPDFLIDLGDTIAMDNGSTSVPLGDIAAAEQRYKDALPFFNLVSASSPVYLVAGNHEQQEAWHLQGTLANSLPVMSKNAEKKFFLNPANDSFYSGDTSTYSYLSGDQLKQDYYAWTWGDALFVVISPFWTTTTKPYTTTVGGGETDATGSGDRWDWTLGLEQFNWLKTTLQNSDAKYKFVFSHQIIGGNGMTSPNQVNYGHGGVDSANLVEWGGYNVGGTVWAWDTERPGWGSQPIRQMLEANHVTAFFHGHDHQFAHESLNGMVYQAVPSGSFTGSFGNYTTGGNSGNTIWADSTQGPGHLRVTVSPTQTTVDFIRYNASSPAYTYTIEPAGEIEPGTVTLDGAVSSGSADGVSSINVPHTTGTGTNRLMLVGVSANSYNGARTISSVTFTPSGGSAVSLSSVGSVENEAGRLAAIYSLVDPPSGVAGTVTVTFSGSVANGIAVGIANFAGVDQSDPLDDFVSAVGTEAAAISVDVPTDPNDLVFDTVFLGGSPIPSLTVGASQTQRWNATIDRVRGAASTEQATTDTTPMSWAASGGATSYYWAMGAVPINPASVAATYTITASAGAGGSISPSGEVTVNAGDNQTFTLTPTTGYHVTDVLVDGVSVGVVTTYTFEDVAANHTIAASFAVNTYTLNYTAGTGGTVTGETPQTVNYGGDGTAVTAVANTGYHFVDWSDGPTANPRTDTNVTANVNVTANFELINTAPVANDQSVTVTEDTAQEIVLTGSDAESDPLTFTVLTQPAQGPLTGTAPNLTYTPAENYNGPDAFTFKVNDGALDSNTATVNITVAAVNDAPVAVADSYATAEGTQLSVSAPGLLGNDSDVDSSALTAILGTTAAHGALSLNADGSFLYTPEPYFNGSDSFTYKANDGIDDGNIVTVMITVTGVNNPPVLNLLADQTVDEGVLLSFTATATDPDTDDTLTFSSNGEPVGAVITSAGDFTWTPDEEQGPNSYTFQVCVSDGTDSDCQAVHVTVEEVNAAPVLAAIGSQSVNEETELTFTAVASDTDLPANTLTYSLTGEPAGAGMDANTGVFIWTPSEAQGPEIYTFDVCVSDGIASDCETLTVTVTEVNTTPLAEPQTLSTPEDTALVLTLSATDADLPANTLTYSVVSEPSHGVLSGTVPDLTYTPDANYYGGDSFTFKVNDGLANSPEATIAITVDAVNDIPTADAQSVTTDEDTADPITLTGADIETLTLSFAVVTEPAHGVLSGTAPSLIYTPDPDYYGPDSFTFKVNDGTADSAPALVSIAVNSMNDAPIADAQNVTTEKNIPETITLTGSDLEGSALTYDIVTNPAHGSLSGTAPNITYTPNTDYVGTDSFTFKVNDGATDSAPATVSIQVRDISVPPMPSSFYGEIHLYDNPPLAGDRVDAYMPGVTGPAAYATISTYQDLLVYSIEVPAGSKGPAAEGDLVTFKINGRLVATGVWHSGTNVRLDFHPPQALPGDPYFGDEGALINFNGMATDWGLDAATYQWDWENDGTFDESAQTPSHSWNDNGTYTVALLVTDAQGGEGRTTFDVTVADVFPANVDAGGPYDPYVGESITLNGSAFCAPVDTCVFEWDLDGDAEYDDATGASPVHSWTAAGSYTISLRVSDEDGNAVLDTAAVEITAAIHSIALEPGWNLVSFNVHPADTAIASVLSSILGSYDLVYAWDATGAHVGSGNWLKADNIPVSPDSLTVLDETMGFWIHMTAADVLAVEGSVPTTTNISLSVNAGGWNLVAYPSMSDQAMPGVLEVHGVGTDYSLVYAYHANDPADPWKLYDRSAPPFLNDLAQLTPGWGYWIRVSADHNWDVEYATP